MGEGGHGQARRLCHDRRHIDHSPTTKGSPMGSKPAEGGGVPELPMKPAPWRAKEGGRRPGGPQSTEAAPQLTPGLSLLLFSLSLRLSLSGRVRGPASWNNVACKPEQALSALTERVTVEFGHTQALDSVWGGRGSLSGWFSVCISFLLLL